MPIGSINVFKKRELLVTSNDNLNANAEFASQFTDATIWNKLVGFVRSVGSTGTLLVEQSFDGETVDCSDSISVSNSQNGTKIDVDLIAEYVRIKYTNGNNSTSEFRLACYLLS